MYKKIESMGSRLLSRLVPQIEASAARCNCWSSCYQCAGAKCCIDSHDGSLHCGSYCW